MFRLVSLFSSSSTVHFAAVSSFHVASQCRLLLIQLVPPISLCSLLFFASSCSITVQSHAFRLVMQHHSAVFCCFRFVPPSLQCSHLLILLVFLPSLHYSFLLILLVSSIITVQSPADSARFSSIITVQSPAVSCVASFSITVQSRAVSPRFSFVRSFYQLYQHSFNCLHCFCLGFSRFDDECTVVERHVNLLLRSVPAIAHVLYPRLHRLSAVLVIASVRHLSNPILNPSLALLFRSFRPFCSSFLLIA